MGLKDIINNARANWPILKIIWPRPSEQLIGAGGSYTPEMPKSEGGFQQVDLNAREKELQAAINAAEKGNYLEASQLQSFENPQLAAVIASTIGYNKSGGHIPNESIERAGGIMMIYNKMEQVAKSRAESIHGIPENNVPTAHDTIKGMIQQSLQQRLNQPVKIDKKQEPHLNQLFNTTMERLGNSKLDRQIAISENYVVARANQRAAGLYTIDCEGPNANVPIIHLRAAISLAVAVHDKLVSSRDINDLGGAAAVLQVMSDKAELEALNAGYDLKDRYNAGTDYLESPSKIVEVMKRQRDIGMNR